MGSLTCAANHLTVEQVKEKLKGAKDVVHFQRWLIVYNALIAPRKASAHCRSACCLNKPGS